MTYQRNRERRFRRAFSADGNQPGGTLELGVDYGRANLRDNYVWLMAHRKTAGYSLLNILRVPEGL